MHQSMRYEAINVKDMGEPGFSTLYFLSYIIIMTVLFTNLVIGIFVNAYSRVKAATRLSADRGR